MSCTATTITEVEVCNSALNQFTSTWPKIFSPLIKTVMTKKDDYDEKRCKNEHATSSAFLEKCTGKTLNVLVLMGSEKNQANTIFIIKRTKSFATNIFPCLEHAKADGKTLTTSFQARQFLNVVNVS